MEWSQRGNKTREIIISEEYIINPSTFLPEIDDEWRSGLEKAWRDELDDSIIQDANEARQQLLEEYTFVTPEGALEALGWQDTDEARAALLCHVKAGEVLAISDHGRQVFPAFQFKHGAVSPWVQAVYHKQQEQLEGKEPDPWDVLTYFSIPRDSLGGLALKDCIWKEGVTQKVERTIRDCVI